MKRAAANLWPLCMFRSSSISRGAGIFRQGEVALIRLATMGTAFSIALSGVIGWVEVAVPDFVCDILGPDSNGLIPVSIALGAVYVIVINGVARTLSMAEIRLGIPTGTAVRSWVQPAM
ncbi:MAG: iron chelate uptake ABC transporter family permease subunit [Candidatus Cryosericum sp.]